MGVQKLERGIKMQNNDDFKRLNLITKRLFLEMQDILLREYCARVIREENASFKEIEDNNKEKKREKKKNL